jgi:hypothetical protein
MSQRAQSLLQARFPYLKTFLPPLFYSVSKSKDGETTNPVAPPFAKVKGSPVSSHNVEPKGVATNPNSQVS